MINVKKGTAHSLAQADYVGKLYTGGATGQVVAGMLGYVDSSGYILKGPSANDAREDLLGFVIDSYTAPSVVSSGKVGMYLLDGNSIIETDQTTETINATNYPVGSIVYAAGSATGLVTGTGVEGTDQVVGKVVGIRTLPSTESVSQSWVDLDGNTVTKTMTVEKTVSVLGIKLASRN